MSGNEGNAAAGERPARGARQAYELAAHVLSLCEQKQLTLATAESCTGGLLAAALTSIPGSSTCFKGGVVSYWADVKRSVLGVDADLIETHGVVSRECAEAMARGAARELSCTCVVSTTGIAGPGGAEPGKPVGTVWIATLTPHGLASRLIHAEGDRSQVREQAVLAAFELIAGELENGS